MRLMWSVSSRILVTIDGAMRPISPAIVTCASTSALEPSAMVRKRQKSRSDRSAPSAMLLATEIAARRICDLRSPSERMLAVTDETILRSSRACCQIRRLVYLAIGGVLSPPRRRSARSSQGRRRRRVAGSLDGEHATEAGGWKDTTRFKIINFLNRHCTVRF